MKKKKTHLFMNVIEDVHTPGDFKAEGEGDAPVSHVSQPRLATVGARHGAPERCQCSRDPASHRLPGAHDSNFRIFQTGYPN